MSIIRIGLSETKDFADGYDAIFGKKKEQVAKPSETAKQERDTVPTEEKTEVVNPFRKGEGIGC